MNTTAKESINRLVEICRLRGIKNVIFSPGSRNAPLVIAFHAADCFQIKTIPDERCAAFFALGQAIASGIPSIICCTSGSAVLNYAPAIVEAYYQRVPMLILTADRPAEWIDQGIGQSMRQNNVYANYIKQSYSWIEEAITPEYLLANDRMIDEAIMTTTKDIAGPVHINIPFQEPLYDKQPYERPSIELIEAEQPISNSHHRTHKDFLKTWQSATKKVIITGLIHPDPELSDQLTKIAEREDIILLTEKTSNIESHKAIQCLDRVLHRIQSEENYKPDLLVSIGGPIVSKKIKQFFQKHKPDQHWFLDRGFLQDTYRANPIHIQTDPAEFIKLLASAEAKNDIDYNRQWHTLQEETEVLHKQYISAAPYSDLVVFNTLMQAIPADTSLHLANSTPVRYAQLFQGRLDIKYFSNRGVSGIDGSTSTALGYASENDQKKAVFITGDMSFLYDSNAFWQKEIPQNLTIILINNGGGGIFRYIPGPGTTEQLESVFEAKHDIKADALCQMYNIKYTAAENQSQLKTCLEESMSEQRLSLIEIFTPYQTNGEVLRSYFDFMKT